MSIDTFEDELRSLLHDTADAEGPAYVDVDPGVVLLRGRRVVRRRRIATGAATAAAVLVVGVAGVAGVAASRSGVDGVEPVPGTSTSGPATGTVSVDLTRTADTAPEGGAPDGRPVVRVTVDRVSGRVDYYVDRGGAFVRVGTATMPTSPQAATWISPAGVDGLVIGIVPAAATDLVLAWAGDAPGSTRTMEPLGSTSFQAFAIWHSGDTADTSLAGLDWTDGDAVYSSLGLRLPSGRSGAAVAFVDRALGLFGIIDDGTAATKSLVGLPADQVPVLMSGKERSGSAVMDNTVLVVLPAGSQGVHAQPSAGVTIESVSTSLSTTADTIVILRVTAPRSAAGTGVHRVTWVNPDGTPGSVEGSGL